MDSLPLSVLSGEPLDDATKFDQNFEGLDPTPACSDDSSLNRSLRFQLVANGVTDGGENRSETTE